MTGPRPGRAKSTRGRGAGAARGRGGRGGARGGAAASSAAEATPITDESNGPATSAAPEANMTDAPPVQSSETDGVTPTTTSQAAATGAPPRIAAAARGARAGGRFMPRAIRRSQLDREAIAAQEVAKVEDKATLDARLKRGGRGGRGGARRARGGPAIGGFDRVIRGGQGGFGSGIQASGSGMFPNAFAVWSLLAC